MMKYFEIVCALSWMYWPFITAPILWPVNPAAAFGTTLTCVIAAIYGVTNVLEGDK